MKRKEEKYLKKGWTGLWVVCPSGYDQSHSADGRHGEFQDSAEAREAMIQIAPIHCKSRYGARLHGGYMRILLIILAAVSASGTATLAVAQHQHNHDMSAPSAPDAREFVRFPPMLVEETLANMRDHLQTLQEIQLQLGTGHPDIAAKLAETRLGMSSLGLHGAAEVSKYMPQGMQDAGTAMHRAASRFAVTAQDASVTGDLKPVFAGLAEITAQCVGCHAGYRLK